MSKLVTDPVCQMQFTADKAAATFKLNRRTYYFCHVVCLRLFEANPLAYVGDTSSESDDLSGETRAEPGTAT